MSPNTSPHRSRLLGTPVAAIVAAMVAATATSLLLALFAPGVARAGGG